MCSLLQLCGGGVIKPPHRIGSTGSEDASVSSLIPSRTVQDAASVGTVQPVLLDVSDYLGKPVQKKNREVASPLWNDSSCGLGEACAGDCNCDWPQPGACRGKTAPCTFS